MYLKWTIVTVATSFKPYKGQVGFRLNIYLSGPSELDRRFHVDLI